MLCFFAAQLIGPDPIFTIQPEVDFPSSSPPRPPPDQFASLYAVRGRESRAPEKRRPSEAVPRR